MGASTYEGFRLTKDPRERIHFVSRCSTVYLRLKLVEWSSQRWMLQLTCAHQRRRTRIECNVLTKGLINYSFTNLSESDNSQT